MKIVTLLNPKLLDGFKYTKRDFVGPYPLTNKENFEI